MMKTKKKKNEKSYLKNDFNERNKILQEKKKQRKIKKKIKPRKSKFLVILKKKNIAS